MNIFFFFFFQAEDGIRDYKVTGVQTCALPICLLPEDVAGSRAFYAMRVGPAREMNSATLPKTLFGLEILATENDRVLPAPKDQKPNHRSRHLRVVYPFSVETRRREDFESENPNLLRFRETSEEPCL